MSNPEVSLELSSHIAALYSPEQYASVTHSNPYCYAYGKDSRLQYVGVRHTFEPGDTVFSIISGALRTRKPDVVFVEGVQGIHGPAGIEKLVGGLSYTEAILRGGEAVYTIKEAMRMKIPWASPEPEDADLYRRLISNYFSKEEIFAWFVLHLLPQYQARKETMNFAGYAALFVPQFKAATEWKDFNYDYDSALKSAERILGHKVFLQNIEQGGELTDPIPWPHRWEQQTIFNEMSRVALRCRDETIAEAILNELEAGKRVLVVYGAGHAVMQEPVFKSYFT